MGKTLGVKIEMRLYPQFSARNITMQSENESGKRTCNKIHCTNDPSGLSVRSMRPASRRFFLTALVLLRCALPTFCAEKEHNFARWEKEISAYEQIDKTNPPPKGAWLFIGSSTVRLWKSLAQDFPKEQVINRGFGGSEIMDATHFADRIVFPYEPRMVFLRAGGNDIHAGKSAQEVFGNYQEFVKRVRAKMPETEIVFISQSPAISRWSEAEENKALNQLVEEYVKGKAGLRYIETYDIVFGADGKPRPELFIADKLHFNAAGYKLLAERVRGFLEKER